MSTSPKPFCFALMPFSDEFNDTYRFGIKEASTEAGAYCERVDEQIFQERILDRIYNQISKADIIIADMTGRNANVFYEVGYAHALGKPTILLTRNADDIPFDLKHFPHIVYGSSIASLREQLTKRVRWCVDNRDSINAQAKIDVELFVDRKPLATGDVVYVTPPHAIPRPTITVRNCSSRTILGNSLEIGAITDETIEKCLCAHSTTTALPSGGNLHMLPPFDDLFPEECVSVTVPMDPVRGRLDKDTPIIFRVFSDAGIRDFSLLLERMELPDSFPKAGRDP